MTRKKDTYSRRDVLKHSSAAVAAIGLGLPTLSRAATVGMDDFKSADVDWDAFKGESLVLGALEHPWSQSIEPLIPVFEELTGISVNLRRQSEAEYVAEMPVKLGAGAQEPDVMMIHALGQFVSAGWAEPLDQYYEDRALFDPGWYDERDLFGMAKEFPVWSDGTRYSMAITAEAQTLFANQAALDAKGLAVPKTMDQLYDAAVKLKSPEMAGIVLRSKSDGTAGTWPCGGFVFSFGGEVIDASGRCVLDSAEAIAAVDMYGKLLKDAGPLGVGNYHWYEVLTDFSSGAAAFGIDSSNFATDISDPEKSVVADIVTYGALPSAGSKPIKPNIWTWQAGINANSSKKRAAFLLLMFINSKPGCLLSSAQGLATPRNSAWESSEFRNRFGNQAAEAALANLNAGDAVIFKRCWFHPKAAEILDPWGIAINEVATGQKTAQAAMTEATGKINRALS